MVKDILGFVQEYWWLILGGAGLIGFGIRLGIEIYRLHQERISAEDLEYDRWFWRTIGGAGLALFIFNTLSNKSDSLKNDDISKN